MKILFQILLYLLKTFFPVCNLFLSFYFCRSSTWNQYRVNSSCFKKKQHASGLPYATASWLPEATTLKSFYNFLLIFIILSNLFKLLLDLWVLDTIAFPLWRCGSHPGIHTPHLLFTQENKTSFLLDQCSFLAVVY